MPNASLPAEYDLQPLDLSTKNTPTVPKCHTPLNDVEDEISVLEDWNGVDEDEIPIVEDWNGVDEDEIPVVEDGNGVDEDEIPVVEDWNGVDEDEIPVVEDWNGVDEDEIPVVEDGNGVDEDEIPVVEDGNGVDEDEIPVVLVEDENIVLIDGVHEDEDDDFKTPYCPRNLRTQEHQHKNSENGEIPKLEEKIIFLCIFSKMSMLKL